MNKTSIIASTIIAFGIAFINPGFVSADDSACRFDLSGDRKEVVRGQLKLGGSNPQGDTISFTNYYMEVNGNPVLSTMGEFHYSRYAYRDWEQEILKIMAGVNDVFLKIDYIGDTAMAFIDGKFLTDNLYYGAPWCIGLKHFAPDAVEKGMYFYFKPIYKEAEFLIDLPPESIPDFSKGSVVGIRSIEAVPEYEVILSKKVNVF